MATAPSTSSSGLWARVKGAGIALPQNPPQDLSGSYNRDQAFMLTAYPQRRGHRRLLALPCDVLSKLPLDALRRGPVVTKAPRPFGAHQADVLIASAVAAIERERGEGSGEHEAPPRSALSRFRSVAASATDELEWSTPPARRAATT